jgi:hypothetical protein
VEECDIGYLYLCYVSYAMRVYVCTCSISSPSLVQYVSTRTCKVLTYATLLAKALGNLRGLPTTARSVPVLHSPQPFAFRPLSL